MSNLSYFQRERNIHLDDHALRAHLEPFRRKNDWAELVCDWYEDPGPKDYQSAELDVPLKRHADGLPRFTFSVFDGCGMQGYWARPGGKQLRQLLNELGRFVVKRPGRTQGRADFIDEAGTAYAFVVDYEQGTITVDPPPDVPPVPTMKVPAKRAPVSAPRRPPLEYPKNVTVFMVPKSTQFILQERTKGTHYRVYEGRLGRPSSVKQSELHGLAQLRARTPMMNEKGYRIVKSVRMALQVWDMVQKLREAKPSAPSPSPRGKAPASRRR
ncbi:hypothetical protein A176_000615 [Myxococcus hansupus]|uniref:Uncharacterized protein n=1 Tax=Pseudomyxococcus hansupus TaxID=1297742 RepID=A0A0H4WQ37_9BACT|nr:hypothetical protein [Myxococcus hansupus]AKQ63703.1 hypothetical protein A176_000615 [Myxococcus hansupus]